jgi:hypothetical protein
LLKEGSAFEITPILSLSAADNKYFYVLLSSGCAYWLCANKEKNPLHYLILSSNCPEFHNCNTIL